MEDVLWKPPICELCGEMAHDYEIFIETAGNNVGSEHYVCGECAKDLEE